MAMTMKKKKTTQNQHRHSPSKLSKFFHLNWKRPHSTTGVGSVLVGVYLVYNTLQGHIHAYQIRMDSPQVVHHNQNKNFPEIIFSLLPVQVLLYVTLTLLNAIYGYRIAHLAWPDTAPLFRKCAILQCLLCYYIVRFLPHWKYMLHDNHDPMSILIVIVDIIMALLMVPTIFSFFVLPSSVATPTTQISMAFATCALLLVAVYPVQLAMGGYQTIWGGRTMTTPPPNFEYYHEDWWTCIQQRYPLQGSAMSAFIYQPTTLTFSLLLFGATLYQRKIVSALTLGSAFVGGVMSILCMTVLSQEIHVPYVSTQRIYLPCLDPPLAETTSSSSWEHWMLHHLDFSLYSRALLAQLWGIEVVPPPEGHNY